MAIAWPAKKPGEVLDYVWNPNIDKGDALATAAIALTDGDAVINNQGVTGDTLTAVLSGGTNGTMSVFAGVATTTGGRTIDETIYLPVAEAAASSLAAQLAAALPGFTDAPLATIDFWLTRAARVVTWDDGDFEQMLLAAHYMTINGIGSGAAAQLAGQGLIGAKSIRSGSLSVDFGEGGSAEGFKATSFGTQFLALAGGRFIAATVTGTGTICGINSWPY